jgi:hypothetical protein
VTGNSPLTWVGVAGFEPAASSSRTSGAAGRFRVAAATSVCWRSCSLAIVRGRCCTFALYVVRVTPCLQIGLSSCAQGADLASGLSLIDRHVPLGDRG